MSAASCFSCCTASFKVYHFNNFTWTHETLHHRLSSLREAFSLSSLRIPHPFNHHESPGSSPGESHRQFFVKTPLPSPAMPDYKPPPGPPPSGKGPIPYDGGAPQEAPPPAYSEPWRVVPESNVDHSDLPPPPSIQHDTSFNNASENEATRAHAWTDANPLSPPRQLSEFDRKSLAVGFSSLSRPREFTGSLNQVRNHAGLWHVESSFSCTDCCLLSTQPLYSPTQQHAAGYADVSTTAAAKAAEAGHHPGSILAYFEVRLISIDRNAGVAVGFTALPYPTWRLPGWERASIGVHGDDGRRFINDTWGGRDFTAPFRAGDTIGLGIEFKVAPRAAGAPPAYGQPAQSGARITVFMTRGGHKAGEWDLYEPIDAESRQPGGVFGLEGWHDLHAAVGVYGAARFDVVFGRHNWLYRPDA